DAPARCALGSGLAGRRTRFPGEGSHRPVGTSAFSPQARREGPAEVAGAAHIALPGTGEIVHPAHPHASVAGINHDDAIVRYVPRELGADAFGATGRGVRGQGRLI